MRSSVALSVLLTFLLLSYAKAESTAEAMEVFGLIGTWSPDCAISAGAQQAHYRITFAAPTFGSPTRLTVSESGSLRVTIQSEVLAATRATNEKIKLTVVVIDGNQNGVSLNNLKHIPVDVVYEQIGNKIFTIDQSGNRTTLEKCLN